MKLFVEYRYIAEIKLSGVNGIWIVNNLCCTLHIV